MYRLPLFILLAWFAAVPAVLADTTGGSFPRVKAKTFDKKKFVFPDDLRATKLNLVFLIMAKNRDEGEKLQLALIEWQSALEQRGALVDGVMVWHFPVMSGLPFFIKGVAAKAMGKVYEGQVPLDQAAVLFVDDLDEFAAASGQVVDNQPTIVITTPDARQLQTFKGDVTPEGADEVTKAIAAYLADANN
jgi:hypothetical protein